MIRVAFYTAPVVFCLLLIGCKGCGSNRRAADATIAGDTSLDRGRPDIPPGDGPVQDAGLADKAQDSRREADRGPWALDFGPLPDIDPGKCPTTLDAGHPATPKPSLTGMTFGSIVWDTEVFGSAGKLVARSSSVAARDGRIYVAAPRFGHLALDTTGKLLWTRIPPIPDYQRVYTSLHATGSGLASLLTTPGKVQLLSRDTGAQLWSVQVPGPYAPHMVGIAELSFPVVSLPDDSLVVGGENYRVTRIQADGTKVLFQQPVHGLISFAGLAGDATRIFVGLEGAGRIAALALDGTPLWERHAGANAYSASPALGPAAGLIALGAPNSATPSTTVSVFDRSCGKLRWQKSHQGAWIASNAVRVGVRGEIAVLAHQRKTFLRIHSYSPTGAKLWQHEFEPTWPWRFPWEDGSVVQTFGPVGADNTLYILRCQTGTQGFRNLLEGFDLETGVRRHRAELPFAGCVGRQAVLLDNGLLIVTAQDITTNMHIIAIQTLSPGLASSPWPTYCANNARTCNDAIP